MKKIVFLLINIILIIFIIILYINKKEVFDYNNLENNIVKITKKTDIIKNNENPRGIFGLEGNTRELISSGFFIDKNTIITVAHGVNNQKSKYIINDNFGNIYEGFLEYKDLENDLAYLKIENDFKYFKNFKYAESITLGENIFSIGYEKNKIKIGEIKKIKDGIIFSNILFQEGESGGIMFNRKYEIVGINQAIDLEKNLGVTKKIND